jgi:peptidoglycan hydrolase CwlO-like protein
MTTEDQIELAQAKLEGLHEEIAAAESMLADRTKLLTDAQRAAQQQYEAEAFARTRDLKALVARIAERRKELDAITADIRAAEQTHAEISAAIAEIRKRFGAS